MNCDLKFITPVCEAKYIWLFQPNEKFGSVYSVTCVVEDSPEWDKLIKTVSEELDAYYNAECLSQKKKNLKRCQYLPWKTEDDGTKVFVVKNNAKGTKKDGTTFETKPKVIGPDGLPLDESELQGPLGKGTRLRCGFTVNLWRNDAQGVGVSARLYLAQIIEPKYYSLVDQFVDMDGNKITTHPKNPALFKQRSAAPGTPPASQTKPDRPPFDADEALAEEDFLKGISNIK